MTTEGCPPTTELPAGSAAFTIIAIMLGLLAQPEGALCLSRVESEFSIWRFSPLHSALETVMIIYYVLRGFYFGQKHSNVAISLMTQRTPLSDDDDQPLRDVLGRPKLELTLPLTLQMVKLAAIRGSPLTQILGGVYWAQWAAVQWIHFIAHRSLPSSVKARDGTLETRWSEVVVLPDWLHSTGYALRLVLEGATFIALISLGLVYYKRSSGSMLVTILVAPLLLTGGFLYYFLIRAWIGMFIDKYLVNEHHDPKDQNVYGYRGVGLQGLVWILGYYIFFYDSSGTYRPHWLDWLG